MVLAHLSPTQRRALRIADNRISDNAGWDDEMLAELAALRNEDVDLALRGFDEADLESLLDGAVRSSASCSTTPASISWPSQRARFTSACLRRNWTLPVMLSWCALLAASAH
jgi:hypothetical protein